MKTRHFACIAGLVAPTFFASTVGAQMQNGQFAPQGGLQGVPQGGLQQRGGQNTGQNGPTGLPGLILQAERAQDADSLLLAYGQAVTDPNLARSAIAQLLANYYLMRNQAQTADQATQAVAEANLRFQVLQAAQNQVMIQQNQQLLDQNAQIIALLQGRTAANRGG